VRLPSLDGANEWLNSRPLSSTELRGRVVLVNFWTLTCINWLRQEPFVRAWSQAYRDDGLVVIGVHTPEFPFEHEVDRVRVATEDREIDYPIAIDNDYEVWNAFANHYWPALYCADADGVIRDQHFGEGRYEASERLIQGLLGVDRVAVSVEGTGVEAAADWDNLRSPETYLRRPGRFDAGISEADARASYEFPERLRLNEWALAGEWTIGGESVILAEARGSIAFRFHARDAHLVMAPGRRETIPFRLRLDGEPPGRSHGDDVDEEGRGTLDAGRLYQLVRAREAVRDRTLELEFLQPGAEAYCFTFG